MSESESGVVFPRKDDGLGWAYQLQGGQPEQVWERFSPGYETQAEAVLNAIADLGLTALIDWAGSEDGEAAIGLNDNDQIAVLFQLEDPVEARLIAQAIEEGRLAQLVAQAREG